MLAIPSFSGPWVRIPSTPSKLYSISFHCIVDNLLHGILASLTLAFFWYFSADQIAIYLTIVSALSVSSEVYDVTNAIGILNLSYSKLKLQPTIGPSWATWLCLNIWSMGAATAQWFCLRLPSCHTWFESQAHHHYYHLLSNLSCICRAKSDEYKQKEAGYGPFNFFYYNYSYQRFYSIWSSWARYLCWNIWPIVLIALSLYHFPFPDKNILLVSCQEFQIQLLALRRRRRRRRNNSGLSDRKKVQNWFQSKRQWLNRSIVEYFKLELLNSRFREKNLRFVSCGDDHFSDLK